MLTEGHVVPNIIITNHVSIPLYGPQRISDAFLQVK